jgi:ferredoxin-thioredoxin reductase catalytic subunit
MRTLEDLEKIAIQNNLKLNPNSNIVKEKEGEYYCPCKPMICPENICPCTDFKKEIKQTGHCHCNLFFQK